MLNIKGIAENIRVEAEFCERKSKKKIRVYLNIQIEYAGWHRSSIG